MTLADAISMTIQFAESMASTVNVNGPMATSVMDPGSDVLPQGSTCQGDEAEQVGDPGSVVTTVGVYGEVELRLPVPVMETGVMGLAGLYPSVFVVDGSYPAWEGTGTNIKALTGGALPVPDMSASILDDDRMVQPRPGTMPGLYVLQVGRDFYHYGGPLESGANPQKAAVYDDVTDGPSPPPLSNNLSGARLVQYPGASPAYIEIQHVDGTVARFDSFDPYIPSYTPTPTRKLWRLTSVRDPYDNLTTYGYDSWHRLTSVAFPSGLAMVLDYAPSWSSMWASGYDCLEIRYTQGGQSPTEAAARTWGLVFNGTSGTAGGKHFGKRLFRTYSSSRPILVDSPASGPYAITSGSTVTGQIVREFAYDVSNRILREYHKVHSGTAFDPTLTGAAGLNELLLHETRYNLDGRAIYHGREQVAESLTFSYPTSGLRSTDLLSGAQIYAIQVANASGTTRRYDYDFVSGRIYSMVTTPSTDLAGRPRATHSSTENSGIGGVAGSDIEPDSIEIYDIYDANCVCRKPIERRMISKIGSNTYTRTWNFEYDSSTKLLTKRKEPNPDNESTNPLAQIEWTFTYVQAKAAGQAWGAWLPATEVTPDGTWVYTHSDWLNRADASNHGQMPRTTTKSMSGVRLQTALTGSPTASTTDLVETVWRNLSNLPASLPQQGSVNGQPRKMVDGDGVETIFSYNAAGRLMGIVTQGDVETAFGRDAVGNMTSITRNVGSSHVSTTTIDVMLGVGVPNEVSSTSGGLLRRSLAYYDRFGHLSVLRQNNLGSDGFAPQRHGGSSSPRGWVETQHHYQHKRLMETYVDRQPRDEAAGAAQFLVTVYDYASDGRLNWVQNPNGSKTHYLFDGYGTLYTSTTKNPTATSEVRAPKTFINPFLEVTGRYEFTGTAANQDHLWTLITRNAAGAIVKIKEPQTTAPSGYTGATGGAVHVFKVDLLGRVKVAEAYDPSETTVLTRRKMAYDQLSRQISQEDEVLGYGSGSRYAAWRYAAGKATQLHSKLRTGAEPTVYTYLASSGLLQKQDFDGNLIEYTYHSKTAYLSKVERTDLGNVGADRVTVVNYDVDPFGRVTAVKVGSPQLVHGYAYDSLGRVDRYTDPMGRLQKFVFDGLGRSVEHVRLGAGSDFIRNSTSYTDGGLADGRTWQMRTDGLDNATITHWDFAGRPFIVQNPGGDIAPTAASPHQSMSLFAEYDGASRLRALYDGDGGKTVFWRDGPGRVIQRQLDGYTGSSIALWNTKDVLKRDAIGRLQLADHYGDATGLVAMGDETFQQDSLGRVHQETFRSPFASTHTLSVTTSWAGGAPYRGALDQTDNLSMEGLQIDFAHDVLGRLSEVQWDKASGAGGSMAVLAEYTWVGGLRETRAVQYKSTAFPHGLLSFTWDGYGRLMKLKNDVYTASSVFTTESMFDYEYDAASNLTKERYTKVSGRKGDRFAYDAYHRLQNAWMGVDEATMNATSDPTTFSATAIQEHLVYALDAANNRETTSSQTGASPATTSYEIQDGSHPQGPSNRYDTVTVPGASGAVLMEYDSRGNLTYDGRFVYRYDFLNRLQEVWRVIPDGDPVGDQEKMAVVQQGSLDLAREDVKLEVPNLFTRLAHEHADPTFRNRLRATIVGGVLRITPTAQGGGGRPGWLPVSGTLELSAVYVYDAFNRRTLSIVVDPSVGETQMHAWDGWRQVSQHKIEQNAGGVWVATPTKQFVWGSDLDELVAYRRNTGSAWENYYLLHGGQETAAKLVDENGNVVETYEYDPYGRVSVFVGASTTAVAESAYGLPFLWKSVRLDQVTGLLQMRNRYYSVELGRFLTRDPLGAWADSICGGNGYDYVGCVPLVMGDAMGLQGRVPGPPRFGPRDIGVDPGDVGDLIDDVVQSPVTRYAGSQVGKFAGDVVGAAFSTARRGSAWGSKSVWDWNVIDVASDTFRCGFDAYDDTARRWLDKADSARFAAEEQARSFMQPGRYDGVGIPRLPRPDFHKKFSCDLTQRSRFSVSFGLYFGLRRDFFDGIDNIAQLIEGDLGGGVDPYDGDRPRNPSMILVEFGVQF